MTTPAIQNPACRGAQQNGALHRSWVLTFLWIAVIALESAFGSVSHTSLILAPLLQFLWPHLTAEQFVLVHAAVRKAGHFTGYATLSFLSYRSWWTTLRARSGEPALSWRSMVGGWNWRAAVLALLTTLAVAGADEFHQTFEPGRTGSAADIALDEMGGLLAQSAIVIFSTVSLAQPARRRKAEPERITSS